MLFSQLVFLALPVAIHATTYAQVYSDLQNCDAKVVALKNAIAAANPCDSSKSAAIITAESNLENCIKGLTSDCSAVSPAPVSTTDAQQFIAYCNGQLLTDTTSCVDTLIAARTALNTQPCQLDSIVKTDLCKLLKYLTDACTCLKSKAPTSEQSNAQAACDKLINQIKRAQTTYGTSTTCTTS